MRRLLDRLAASPRRVVTVVLAGLGVNAALFLAGPYAHLPAGPPLDERIGYSDAAAVAYLNELGAAGRSTYLAFLATDVLAATVTALLLATVLRALWRSRAPLARVAHALPWTALGADLAENALLTTALLSWPDPSASGLALAAGATAVKHAAGGLSLLCVVGALVAKGVGGLSRRTRAEPARRPT